jgi:hypothetical protein
MAPLRLGRSYWLDAIRTAAPRLPSFSGVADVEVVIIGGGVTGCAAAYFFANAGARVMLLDRARIGHGSTSASTALLMQEPDTDFSDLAHRYGRAIARRIWRSSRGAVDDMQRTLRLLHVPTVQRCPSVYLARELIRDSFDLLKKLTVVKSTLERESLVGSAYKRLALVYAATGTRRQVDSALRQMKRAYDRAQKVGKDSGDTALYYPASNCLIADVALHAGGRWTGFDRKILATVERTLKAKSGDNADFWSIVGDLELRQYKALVKKKLWHERRPLERAYQDLHKRVAARRRWGSVYDTGCLVLRNYAERATGREREAANGLLELLRTFAHPE